MMAKVTITPEFIVEAMQHDHVRSSCAQEADKIAGAARGLDPDAKITRQDGTRPKGRPYSRITSDDVAGEWGDGTVERRRTLGRAAGLR